MLEATEEEKTHIRRAEKRIQDIGVDDTESTMEEFEENLSSVVPIGKGIIRVLELDLNDVSKNRCVRKKLAPDNYSDDSDDSDSESESDLEEEEEPVNYQMARTCVQQNKSNNSKQTARQRITDFLGVDSLHLNRDRLASLKQERRSLIASQKNTSSSSSSPE
jgi:hypothetical protein